MKNTAIKIIAYPFIALKRTLKRVKYLLELKHQVHTTYILLIALHWIIGYAFITGSTFYEQYINTTHAKNTSVQLQNRIQPEMEPILQPGTEAWIKEQWETRTNAKWENVYAVIQGESGWNSDAWRCNGAGNSGIKGSKALDLGLYQGNSQHDSLSPSCALSTICSTNWSIDLYNEQGFAPWMAAAKLGIR